MSRLRPRAVLLALLLALAGGEAAAAAPPQNLGQNPISTEGGCTLCSVVQLSNSGAPNAYVFPGDGVLTTSRFYVATVTEATDFAQARVFRKTGGSSATVIGEGQKHLLNGLSAGIHTYFERIPGKAGDVLGARFDTTPNVNGTPHVFATASGLDEAGYISIPDANPEVGDPFTSAPIANRRVNVAVTFEPDEDGDGYGDTSQDLCPGAPVATTACSGTLVGSGLQGPYKSNAGCGYACLRVQTAVDGESTASPFDGVVVRWRVLGSPGGYRIRVVQPTGGSNYSILRSSAIEEVASSPFTTMRTFATQLPIPAGAYVGLVPPPFTNHLFRESAPGSIYRQVNDSADGSSSNFDGYGPPHAGEILYDADVEPDADGDGFGDLTQDACATDGSIQSACASAAGQPLPEAKPRQPVKPRPRCHGTDATRVGSVGRDRLVGTRRADVIVSLGGNDTIVALGGNDLVCAGPGNDTIKGGSGKDQLFGERGVDRLYGGAGRDRLIGGPGRDRQRQ